MEMIYKNRMLLIFRLIAMSFVISYSTENAYVDKGTAPFRKCNVPVKVTTIESCQRGGVTCSFKIEFPKEMIKTDEFKF